MTRLPCQDNTALYDTALYDRTSAAARRHAVREAAALCAGCVSPCEQKITLEPVMTDCCSNPSYGTYLAHKKRGEDACEASKAKKREYDQQRYAKDPRRARAPQRAYEARQRAAKAQQQAVGV